MIKPGTKYVIVGVHKDDAWASHRKELYGAIVEARSLRRRTTDPINYWQGWVRFKKPIPGLISSEANFLAVYLRRVYSEEAKP